MIHADLWKQLAELDTDDVCRRSGVERTNDGAGLSLPVLGKQYRIDPAERTVLLEPPGSSDKPAGFHLQLSAVNYLIRAQDVSLAGELVNEKQFPTGPLFFRGPHEMPTEKLEARFGTDKEAFEAAGRDVGGRPVPHGDTAVELPVFPRLPITVVLWLGDDEFPARVSYLFDRTANRHLLLDGLWSAAHVVRDELISAAGEP